MKKQILTLSLALATVLSFSSCRPDLTSESGLYTVPLTHSFKVPVDGFWVSHDANPFAKQRSGLIYIAPLNVKEMTKDHPDLAHLLQDQMHQHMVNRIGEHLAEMNKDSKLNWKITENRASADMSIELAVVKFSPQSPVMKVISSIGGFFMPIPGVSTVVGKFAAGSIAVEGVIRDEHHDKVMLAFKDSNRKTVRLYKKNAYDQLGQADENMKHWADRLGTTLYNCHFDSEGRVYFDQSSVGDSLLKRASNQL